MLTHGYWHDFTVSILKCKEVMKIYRDHPHGLKVYCFVSQLFYITQHPYCLKDIFYTDLHLLITYILSIILYIDDIYIYTYIDYND